MKTTSSGALPPTRRRGPGPRRFALLLLLPALLALAPPGCGEKKPSTTTIRFVTWKPNVPEAWDAIYRAFREEHPEITLEVEVGPHSSTAFHNLLTRKLKNRSPDIDVFLMDVIWPTEFASAGWTLPLNELVPETARREFLPGAIVANTYRGELHGLPLFIDSGILFYRKDLLEKHGLPPPRTWGELADRAERIVAAERLAGNEMHGFSGEFKQYEGLVCDMMEFICPKCGWEMKIISFITEATVIWQILEHLYLWAEKLSRDPPQWELTSEDSAVVREPFDDGWGQYEEYSPSSYIA